MNYYGTFMVRNLLLAFVGANNIKTHIYERHSTNQVAFLIAKSSHIQRDVSLQQDKFTFIVVINL